MELYPIKHIAARLGRVTEALLRDVDDAAARVFEVRPLLPDVVKRALDNLLGERVFSSNAIEGNTYDLRETRAVLKAGHIIDGARRKEGTEVVNLGNAIRYAEENLTTADTELTVQAFLELHTTLLQGFDNELPGRFRDRRVMIRGAKYQPPDDRLVPGMVDQFFERFSQATDEHPVLVATWAHWTIARIHPFCDGNGRMARLWQDIILFRRQLTCAIIRSQDREDYLRALESADEDDFDPLTQLVAQRVASTLDRYLDAQRSVDEVKTWAADLAGEADERVAEERTLAYTRWKRWMERLRSEFERCAVQITQASSNIEVQFKPYDMIDLAKWTMLRSGGGATRTWFFILSFRRDQRFLSYIFFFGKHYWSHDEAEAERTEPTVALLISEQEGHDEARRLGEDSFFTPLALREIFVSDTSLVRKRNDPETESMTYDHDLDPLTVAQEFIQEVLRLRLP